VTIRNPVFRPQISIEATLQICSREDRRRIGWATRPISSLIDQVRDRSRVSSGTGSFPSPGSQRIRLIASTKILRSPWKINSPCSNIIIPVQPMKLWGRWYFGSCPYSLVLWAVLFQRRNSVCLSQQISEHYFSAYLFSKTNKDMHCIIHRFVLLFTISFCVHCSSGQLIGFHHYDPTLPG
jgi:hypothetical protein